MNLKLFLKKAKRKIWGGNPSISELRLGGAIIGENCHIYGSVDNGHEFLLSIGDNVTLASGSRLLTHDGSTKKILGYSKIGRIDNGSTILAAPIKTSLPISILPILL